MNGGRRINCHTKTIQRVRPVHGMVLSAAQLPEIAGAWKPVNPIHEEVRRGADFGFNFVLELADLFHNTKNREYYSNPWRRAGPKTH